MKYLYRCIIWCFLLSAFSCVKYSNLVILNEEFGSLDTSSVATMEPYKIQNKDVLDISVATTDEASINIFTKSIGNESDSYVNGYVVDDSGFVSMPIIGDIYVVGKTRNEIKTLIQSKISHYYKYATVNVNLLSFRVSVLGEVQVKGTFSIPNGQVNLLELLSMAGGFSDFSKIGEVKIIRTVGGKAKMRIIDFRSENIMNDPWFYLQPYDIVYVEPLRVKSTNKNLSRVSLAVSLASVLVIIVNFLSRN